MPRLKNPASIHDVAILCVRGGWTVAHVRNHEEADRVLRLSARASNDALVEISIAGGRDRTVGPASDKEKLPASIDEHIQVWRDVDHLVFWRIGQGGVPIKIDGSRPRMPRRIFHHQVPEQVRTVPERFGSGLLSPRQFPT